MQGDRISYRISIMTPIYLNFIDALVGLLIYGSILFAVTQYYDTKYDSFLKENNVERYEAKFQPLVEARILDEAAKETLRHHLDRIGRWDHDSRRPDVHFQALLLIIFSPILIFDLISNDLVNLLNEYLRSEHALPDGKIWRKGVLLAYSATLFCASIITFIRIKMQARSVRGLKVQLQALKNLYDYFK